MKASCKDPRFLFITVALFSAACGMAQDSEVLSYDQNGKPQPFKEGVVLARTKQYRLTWPLNLEIETIRFELWSVDNKLWESMDLRNSGMYNLIIPVSVRKGDNYVLRVYRPSEMSPIYTSSKFSIRSRYPIYVKVGAVAVIATVGVLTSLSSSNSPQQPENKVTPMPDPPDLPPN